MRKNIKFAAAKNLVLVFLFAFLVPIFATAPAAKAAAFNSGAGRSWDVYAQAVGGGQVVAGQPMEVVVTLQWDTPMYMYAYNSGSSGTYRTIGSTSTTRVPSMYFAGSGTTPGSDLSANISPTQESGLSYFTLSSDFKTATWVFKATAASDLTGKYVYAYSRGTPFWNDSYNFSQTANFNLTSTPPTSAVSRGSLSFSGSNYLTAPSNSDWNFGTGDFTVEWWQKFGTQSSTHPRVFSLGCYSSTRLQLSIESGTFWVAAGSSWAMNPVPATSSYVNVWSHFALVRSSGTLNLYQNGKSIASVANTTALDLSASTLTIGAESPTCTGSNFVGQITDFRISKYATYSSTFTPTTGLTAYADTLILLNANQSAPTTDSSSYARTITNSGSVSSSTSYPLVPTISSLSVSSGSTGGGTSVVVTGTNLSSVTNAQFGGTNATIGSNTSTSVTLTTPAHVAGLVDLSITTAGGTGFANGSFTFASTPTITSLSATSGSISGGTSVTITGTNLSGVSGITFGGTAGTSISSNTSTSVTVVTPAHTAGAVDVVLTATGGSVTSASAYTYVAAPTISGATISGNKVQGQVLTAAISGAGGGTATSTTYQWQSSLDGSIGSTFSNIGTNSSTFTLTSSEVGKVIRVAITVSNAGGSNSATSSNTSVIAAIPTFTSISPTSGPTAGTSSVTIRGTGFQSGATVTIGGASATSVNFVDSTTVTAVTPSGTAGTANVVLTNPDGGSVTGSAAFTYVASPTITSLSVTKGSIAGNTSVIIAGTNLSNVTGITFGGTAGTSISSNTSTSVTIVTPAHSAGLVDVVLTTAGGSVTSANAFTFATSRTITYLANGGSGTVPTQADVLEGNTFTVASGSGITNSPLAFSGWNDGTSIFQPSAVYTVGSSNVTLTARWSDPDANLSALSISAGALNVGFASATTSYTSTVTNAITSVKVTPTTSSNVATVTVNGTAVNSGSASNAISLNTGSNTLTIVVTAQSGATKTYTITMTRGTASITTPPTIWALLAAGERTSVLAATSTNVTTLNNGTYFYNNSGASMGFAPVSSISQNSADTTDSASCNTVSGTQRLSWHESGGSINGGWRYGCVAGLNSDNTKARAIYQSNSPTYYPSGPQLNVTESTLTSGGWSLCYLDGYGTGITYSTVANSCNQTYLLLAGGAGAVIVNPTISSISPNSGTTSGSTSVTITGTGFAAGATVKFGANNGTSVNVVSATQITVSTPAGSAGAVNVVVTNTDGGTVTSTNAFTYQGAPTIASASITGTANMGQTLTASAGAITTGGLTTTTTYQWKSASTSSGTYTNIGSNDTGTAYVITNKDIGRYIKLVITVTNSAGSASATSSATALVNDGLFARYDAGNSSSYSGSGTTLNDLSGAGFTGTLSGATGVPVLNPVYGKSFTFNAANSQYIDLGSMPAFDFSNGFTATFWANFGSVQNNWERILDFGNANASNNVWVGRNGTTNKLSIETFTNAVSNGMCSSSADIPLTSTWNHYAVTVDATGCKVYINGTEGHTGSTGVPVTIARSKNYLGRSNWSGDSYFESGIARISLWNRALTPTEISARVTAETPAPMISLSSSSISGSLGTAISSITVTPYGGTPSSYSISPTLPSGLSFSTSTGAVSGTPTSAISSTNYTITANGLTGSPTATFSLVVLGTPLADATAPTLTRTVGSISTSITVSFSAVTNASSYTVRVYQSDGTTLVGSARTNFASGTAITGLAPGTTYLVSVQAIGDGITYSSSVESSKASLATDSGFVNLTITQNVGTAQHAASNWGQTFTVPSGTSGTLTSISNMHMAFRQTFVGTVDAKIYTSPAKTTLLGTATNTCSDTDSSLGGQLYADFNGPDCTFYFTGVSLSSNTSYYFEINRLSGGSTFYLWEYYASGGTLYTGGQNYENGTAYPDWDLKFTVNYSGTPPAAPTLTGVTISGTMSQGQTLTASVAGAGGGAATTTAYQWMRADTSGGTFTNIAGATNSTYLLGAADAFKYIKVKITVSNAGGSNNATSSETSQIAAPSIVPTITSITKNAGTSAGGLTVTITGTNMAAVTAVTFDGTTATISSKTATTVVVVTPAHSAGAVNVVVTNPSGSATSTNGYTYVTPPASNSWTTSLSRTTASLNDTVTVTYTAACTTPQNYGPSMYDLLYVTGGAWTYNSYMGSGTSTDGGYTWTITKTYSLNSTGIWKVDAYERGACWDSYNFTYAPRNTINVGVPGPTITSLATTSGPTVGGTAVVLTGTNLTGVSAVTVGGVAATSIRSNTDTSVTFNTPAGTAGAKDVIVTTAAGSVTSANAFTYVAPVTITYDTNTATSGTPSRSSDLYTPNSGGYALPTVGTMVKTGHTFSGWTTVFDSTTALTSPYNPSTSKTLYAIWTARDYTITYNANGATAGTAPSASLNTYGSSVNLADNSGGSALVRTGYTLTGWLINGTVYNINAIGAFTMPAGNLIAYANWQINTYSVAYDKNGSADATPSTQSGINANGTVTLAAAVTKASYAFVGWEENGVTYAAGSTYRIGSADVTMVAKWIPIYTVSYNLNGTGATGTLPNDVLKSDGETLTVTSTIPVRSGYTFGGWVDQSGGAHASGSTYTISSSNYLLYGVWTANSYNVTYNLAGGGSAVPTESAKTYKASFNLAAVPTKTGYTFTGWSDSSTVYSALSSYLMPAADVTLTAQWTVNAYTITYDLAQGTSSVPAPVNKNFGDTWNLPSAPTRVGYNFVNWSDGSATYSAGASYTSSIANNLTITAVWSAIVYYTVTYDLDGGLGTAPIQDPLQNGQSFNLASDPAKTGYSFTGWSYAGTTYSSGALINMPATNITITATWTATAAGTYSITYVTNGAQTPAPTIPALAQNSVFTVDDGSTLIKTGYNFSGWSSGGTIYNGGETVTVGTSNITFSAIWAPASRATYVSNSTDATTITKGRSITVTYSLGCYNSSTLPSITEKVTSTGESFINDITNYLTVVDAGYNWTVTRVYTLSYAGTYTIMATASGGCFSADTDSTPETVVVTEAPASGGSGGIGNIANANSGSSGNAGYGAGTGSIPPVTVVGARIALVANKYYTLPKLAANTTVSVAAKAGATATATTTNANGSISTAATTMLSVNNTAKGLSEVKIVENQLAVIPTVGFSGKTTVSVTVTDGNTTSKIEVPVTVLPEPVKDPTLTPKSATTTVVNWDASPNATNYQVFVDGKPVCKTAGESCTINKILGPNANVDVVANGGDATKSDITDANYKAPVAVTIAKVAGTLGRATLSQNDITNLNKVIATITKQGFDNVQISNITTTKQTAAAAKVRVDAMVNYIKSKVDNPDLVVTVVAPATRTFTNQIAVK